MTLTEALAKLHKAGRIRSPWLPGMRVTYPKTRSDAEIAVLLHARYDLTEPKIEAWDGLDLLRFTFREDGWVVEIRGEDDGFTPWNHEAITWHASPRTWALDLTDAATVGCLLVQLREAGSDEMLNTAPGVPLKVPNPASKWAVYGDAEVLAHGATEGEAIAAALVALAEAT